MKLVRNYLIFFLVGCVFLGCASWIVEGEGIRTSGEVIPPKPKDAEIEIYFSGKNPKRGVEEIGRVSARAWVLEKGVNALRENALQLGADAILNVKYERRFSVDYLQDLYYIDGEAVVWK